MEDFTSRERGLLKVASNKKWENMKLESKLEKDQQFILSLIVKGRLTEEDIWEWVEINKFCVILDSTVFGERTTIQDYVKKDWSIVQAHFFRECFRGTLKQLGTNPVGVQAKYRITRDRFTYQVGGTTLETLFRPVDEDDIPLARLARV
jgi:hypothetical protein